MKIIRTILSVVALLAAALGVATATGVIHWNAALVDLVMSGGTLLGTFGIAPFALTMVEKRVCAAFASFAAAIGAAHASGALPGSAKVYMAVAVGAALLSVLGRWDTPVSDGTPVPPAPTTPTKAA